MKQIRILIPTLLLISLCLSNSVAEDPSQWGLPEDAKARIGKGYITDIKYSPDGTQLAVGSSLGVWLYDAHTGEELELFAAHTEPVHSIAFSQDGKLLASAGYDETIHFWDPRTGEHKAALIGKTEDIIFSSDGATLASSNMDIHFWDVHTLKKKGSLTGHPSTGVSITYSPDGKTLASVSGDTIHLWDVHTEQRRVILTELQRFMAPVTFSPDGTIFATGGSDKTLHLWDTHTGRRKATFTGHTKSIFSVAFSPDGETLASAGSDRTIRLWNVKTGELKATLTGHNDSVSVLVFSPDGATLTSGSRDGTIQIWNSRTGQHKTTWVHTYVTSPLALSPDGKTFFTKDDTEIQLWDVNTGELKGTLTGHTERIFAFTFSQDGTVLGSMSRKEVILWDTRTAKRLSTLADTVDGIFSVAENAYSLALAHDGGMLAVGKNGTVEVWDTATGKRQATFTKHTDSVSAVAFSPDGATLAATSREGPILLWDLVSEKHKATFTQPIGSITALAFSPDNATLAVGSFNGKCGLWHLDTSTYISTFGHQRPDNRIASVNSLAFSADSTMLASGSLDETIRLWDTRTGEHKGTVAGHTSAVAVVAFSKTDATLVSSSADGTILSWDPVPAVETDSLVRITPSVMVSPATGEQLTLNITIIGGRNITGYQVSLKFDTTVLRYISSENGTYLSDGASFDAKVSKIVKIENFHNTSAPSQLKLISTTSAGFSDGDGTLATVTFEVVATKASTIKLSKMRLEQSNGGFVRPNLVNGSIVAPRQTARVGKDYTQFALPEGAIARLGKGKVNDIKYSPDKTLIAVAGPIGIWLYDVNTGDALALLTGHTKPVAVIAFSPNGDKLISGSYDGTLRLWNPHTGELLKTFKTDGRIATLAFSPDGRTLANGLGANIQLWDVDTGQHKTTIYGGGSSIFFLVFSPDGQTLASATLSDTIKLWDLRTGQHINTLQTGDGGTITSIRFSPSGPRLAFSPDGKTLASTAVNMRNVNKKINLWNMGTGELLTTLAEDERSLTYPVPTVQFSSDGTTLISGIRDGTVRMWDLKTGESSTPFGEAAYDAFLMPPFMPDSTTLVRITPDSAIHLLDTKTGETRLTLTEHTDAITSVAFSPDGTTLATVNNDDGASYDRRVQLWDLQTQRRKAILEGHESPNSSVSFSPDGLTLASKSRDKIHLWDVQTERLKNTFTGNGRGVFAASPDGRIFANENGHSIRLLNARTGEHKMTLWGHTGYITSVAFSPDSATLASGSEPPQGSENPGAMIRLWDTKTGKQRLAFIADEYKVSAVAFSTDGETLASTSGPIIRLWDVNTGKRKASLTAYSDDARYARYNVYTRALAFSPDGKTFVSGHEGEMHSRENYHLIHVWDIETGKHLNTLTGHRGGVRSLAYSADGMTLVSASLDGTMLVWKMAPTPTAHVSISPRAIEAPNIGEKLTFNLDISKRQDITGYQLTLQYDATALRYVSTTNGDYLKGDVHVAPPIVHENSVTLAANTDNTVSTGDGVLASVTFEVLTRNASVLKLADVRLSDAQGNRLSPIVHRGWVTEPPRIPADVNHDWHVDAADLEAVSSRLGQTGKGNSADVNNDGIVDIADLVLVIKALSHPTPTPIKN